MDTTIFVPTRRQLMLLVMLVLLHANNNVTTANTKMPNLGIDCDLCANLEEVVNSIPSYCSKFKAECEQYNVCIKLTPKCKMGVEDCQTNWAMLCNDRLRQKQFFLGHLANTTSLHTAFCKWRDEKCSYADSQVERCVADKSACSACLQLCTTDDDVCFDMFMSCYVKELAKSTVTNGLKCGEFDVANDCDIFASPEESTKCNKYRDDYARWTMASAGGSASTTTLLLVAVGIWLVLL